MTSLYTKGTDLRVGKLYHIGEERFLSGSALLRAVADEGLYYAGAAMARRNAVPILESLAREAHDAARNGEPLDAEAVASDVTEALRCLAQDAAQHMSARQDEGSALAEFVWECYRAGGAVRLDLEDVHTLAEQCAAESYRSDRSGLAVPFAGDAARVYEDCETYWRWAHMVGLREIACEALSVHFGAGYACTIDLLCTMAEAAGQAFLIDLKTSAGSCRQHEAQLALQSHGTLISPDGQHLPWPDPTTCANLYVGEGKARLVVRPTDRLEEAWLAVSPAVAYARLPEPSDAMDKALSYTMGAKNNRKPS